MRPEIKLSMSFHSINWQVNKASNTERTFWVFLTVLKHAHTWLRLQLRPVFKCWRPLLFNSVNIGVLRIETHRYWPIIDKLTLMSTTPSLKCWI